MPRLSKPEIILALDVDTLEKAQDFVDKLYPKIKTFKVGSHLFTAYGPRIIDLLHKKEAEVFLDLKYFDIPNTVSSAVAAAVNLKVKMLTLHICGGQAMLEAAVRGAEEKAQELNIRKPLIVGVTRLTSDDNNQYTLEEVLKAAKFAKDSGLDGVVCSALEAAKVREDCGADFIIVTPGIRSSKDPLNDQKRTANVKQAIKAGSNFLVIGRPILEAKDPIAKTEELLGELNGPGN